MLRLKSIGALLAVAVLTALAAPHQRAEESKQHALLTNPAGLKLELKTDKAQYRRGEPVVVTIQLVNHGTEAVFLTPEIRPNYHTTDDWVTNSLEMEVLDAKGDLVPPKPETISSGQLAGEKNPLQGFIRSTRTLFRPGDSRTFSWPARELGFRFSRPGRYRLRVRYFEPSHRKLASKQAFEEARTELQYPWWLRLDSNWVEIEIQR